MVRLDGFLAPRADRMAVDGVEKDGINQDDGALWNVYYDTENPDSNYLIITSAGRELKHGYRGIQKGKLPGLFARYLRTEPDTDGKMRDFLGKGQAAKVYGMGGLIAVREEVGVRPFYSSVNALGIMNQLSSVVEGGLPRWLNVPSYYALLCDPERHKQFTFMERVDHGLTVEDALTYPNTVQSNGVSRVEKEFRGPITEERQERIAELFERAEGVLRRAIDDSPAPVQSDELLLDWAPRNVLVERLRTPVAGEEIRLSVIDQVPADVFIN